MNNKVFLPFVLCLMVCVTAHGQNHIGVSKFRLLETDLTANTSGTTEKDQNGETSALIKVVTTQTGFTFDGGALGIVKTRQTPGEVWVYIPKGAKKITIKHPQLGVLRDYFFPCSIESGRTYEMVLETGTVQTIVTQESNSQYVVFMVNPANAMVEFENEILPITDGVAQKFVKLGTYEYRVKAKDYHPNAGKVTVGDVNNKTIVNVELKPAFGWIEIGRTEDLDGAQVFIDDELAGRVPMKSQNLPSGQHEVKIAKKLYNPYSTTVEVRDNETTTLSPTLTSDYATVTLNVENEADIYVNGEKKGTGVWTGRLATGTYVFEAKKDGHRSTTQNGEISASPEKQQITLDTPTPIYGSVNITSNPSMAEVLIDGNSVGQTPLFISKHLIGEYNVEIRKSGYVKYSKVLNIVEGNSEIIDVSLKKYDIIPVDFDCTYTSAELYVDGKDMGKIKGMKQIPLGEHEIMVKVPITPVFIYKKKITITEETEGINIIMVKITKGTPDVRVFINNKH